MDELDKMAEDILKFQRKPAELKGPLNPDIYPALNFVPAGDMMTPYEGTSEKELSRAVSLRKQYERELLRNKEKYQTDPEYREKVKIRNEKWRHTEKGIEALRKASRRFYEKNKDYSREYQREYIKNPIVMKKRSIHHYNYEQKFKQRFMTEKQEKFEKSMDEFYPGWRDIELTTENMIKLKKEKDEIHRKLMARDFKERQKKRLELELQPKNILVGIPIVDEIPGIEIEEPEYKPVYVNNPWINPPKERFVLHKRAHTIQRHPDRQAKIDARMQRIKRRFPGRKMSIINEMKAGQEEME